MLHIMATVFSGLGDLVDEKGGHEDIHTFAGNADIVVCCLCLNSETVRSITNCFSYIFAVSDNCSCCTNYFSTVRKYVQI